MSLNLPYSSMQLEHTVQQVWHYVKNKSSIQGTETGSVWRIKGQYSAPSLG